MRQERLERFSCGDPCQQLRLGRIGGQRLLQDSLRLLRGQHDYAVIVPQHPVAGGYVHVPAFDGNIDRRLRAVQAFGGEARGAAGEDRLL